VEEDEHERGSCPRVGGGEWAEGGEDSLREVGGAPSVELHAAVEQHLPQPHQAGVVNLDAGDFGFAGHDRQSHALQQQQVQVHVQGLRFETGQAIRNADEFLAQALQILQPLVEAVVLHPVYAHFHPQEGAALFVHTAYQFPAIPD
jgi:hypothetical protein